MVLGKLMGLKVNKSPGPDNLHPRVLKEVDLEIIDPLGHYPKFSVLWTGSYRLEGS